MKNFDRVCGRRFNLDSSGTIGAITKSICSEFIIQQLAKNNSDHILGQSVPFRVTFKTNENEATTGSTSNTNEQKDVPGGIIGFSLNYRQINC